MMAEGTRILDAISSPSDLKLLTNEELAILCQEIREEIIDVTSKNGGHVASSLGAVEIIVALHSLLDCPTDRIVFDVGHQAYAHKILTGRLDRFGTLRQYGGISGFPKPSESPYDAHPSGHASDSLSVAFGLAKARDLRGGDEKIVSVIGDASLAGGMAFEAINHIGQEHTPMVIVLNDNAMSISRPVGAMVKHLGYLRTTSQYQNTRDAVQKKMEQYGGMAQDLLDLGRNVKESIKQFVVPHSMLFEHLGITCTVPIDGNNIAELREILSVALQADAPVLVHAITKKGYGFPPAESNPELFHGVGPFNKETGELVKSPAAAPKYTAVIGKAIVEEAKRDPRIVAITAAMQDGTGLNEFAATFPKRFFDTGIAEGHALGMASGLALGGNKPIVCIYSTFMQRAIDQLIVDNALPNLDVVFCLDRAGLVGDDGPTHHGVFDIAYMSMIPHMRVMTPSNEAELVNALHTALIIGGPVAIRYPRGAAEGVALPQPPEVLPVGVSRIAREGKDVAVLAFGRMVGASMEAADILAGEGIDVRVVDMRWAKPIDFQAVRSAAQTRLIVTVEEGVLSGGAGEGVISAMCKLDLDVPVASLGLPDEFVEQGKVPQLLSLLGLDGRGIAETIRQHLRDQD